MAVLQSRLLSAVAIVAIGALSASANASPVDCAKPSGHEQARACAAAAHGVHELRQFIQRTRAVYILYIHDFENSVAAVAGGPDKAEATKLAGRTVQ